MIRRLFLSAGLWTAYGLIAGVVYRSFSSSQPTVTSQLAVVHTHALALGTLVLLLVALLSEVFHLRAKLINTFTWVWNCGLLITLGLMTAKGMLQYARPAAAHSPALAGISGLGHMTLTAGFIILFVALLRSPKSSGVTG